MSRSMTLDQLAELELLRMQNGGKLLPAKIVEFAQSANTALHHAFQWDDTEAAHKFRLHQAGQVIRAAVIMLPRPDGGMVPVRAYVYDAPRREYALTVDVLADQESADALLCQMHADVQRAIAKYRRYADLAPHIDAALSALAPERRAA